MTTRNTLGAFVLSTVSLCGLAALTTGCELIATFDRAKLYEDQYDASEVPAADSGTKPATDSGAGDASTTTDGAAADGSTTTDGSTTDSGTDATTTVDSGSDAATTTDAASDSSTSDASDAGTD
ncbi:MAG: hypothetical protein U0169_25760 [Polyangiaceae bacterium]